MNRQQTEKDKQNVDVDFPWKNFYGRPWLHEFLVGLRHTMTGTGLGGKQCGARAGWEGAQGWSV